MGNKSTSMNIKLAFLFGVGLLTVLALYLNYKTDSAEVRDEDLVPEETESTQDVKEVDINELEKKYNSAKDDEKSEQNNEEFEKNEDVESADDYDLSNVYEKKFGRDSMSSVEDISEKVVRLFIEAESDFDRWKEYASKEVYEKIQEEISVGDGVVREIKDMNLNYVKADSDEEIKVEVDLSWYLVVEDEPVDVSGNLIYLTFDLSKKDLKVVDVVFV